MGVVSSIALSKLTKRKGGTDFTVRRKPSGSSQIKFFCGVSWAWKIFDAAEHQC